MIRLQFIAPSSVQDAWALLQTAIGVEFGTLPPYLYSLYSIKPGTNPQAAQRIKSIILQEMIHMCLDCNILNALGGAPTLVPPSYPGPLPGDIGPDGQRLIVHLLPFSSQAMQQGMNIETPEEAPDYPVVQLAALPPGGKAVTIGQFYHLLDTFLATLPASAWTANRNQITDEQFFTGQLFAVNGYEDAHRAIQQIVSEGEGSSTSPLDFQQELAHYYRFGEIFHDKVLTRTGTPPGYQWGPAPLGVEWSQAYPAISDPGTFDFSGQPPAVLRAQDACNAAYTRFVDALQLALKGDAAQLGVAVRAMFDLRMAALHAFTVPLANGTQVAGPAFLYS